MLNENNTEGFPADNNTTLEKLPGDTLKEISTYLETPENRNALTMTNKGMYALFQNDKLQAKFLECVAYGQQDLAEKLLGQVFQGQPAKIQAALLHQGSFTDYSGRTFNCSAYEYAYWAKDTHMCRMLGRHMDDDTKVVLLARIKRIDGIDTAPGQPVGLSYQQGGIKHRSAHFDLTPLIAALRQYADGFNNWYAERNMGAMSAAWIEVGMAQRDMPVHVVNEYCRPDRTFCPLPQFNEVTLPRSESVCSFIYSYPHCTQRWAALFPLVLTNFSGLGVSFALMRGMAAEPAEGEGANSSVMHSVGHDLAAVSHLDIVRTADLTQLREILSPTALESGHDMHV